MIKSLWRSKTIQRFDKTSKAKNKVIVGDYIGNIVRQALSNPYIFIGFANSIQLNNTTVESFELITDEHRKSAKSGIARGLVVDALLGPVGMSAKSKGIYQIALQFKDDKRSLIEVDDKIYKAIIKACF